MNREGVFAPWHIGFTNAFASLVEAFRRKLPLSGVGPPRRVGFAVVVVTKPPRGFRRVLQVAPAIGHANTIPLMITSLLCTLYDGFDAGAKERAEGYLFCIAFANFRLQNCAPLAFPQVLRSPRRPYHYGRLGSLRK